MTLAPPELTTAEPVAPPQWGPPGPRRWWAGLLNAAVVVGLVGVLVAAGVVIRLTGLEVPAVQVPARGAAPVTTSDGPSPALQPGSGVAVSPVARVDPTWATRVSEASGIPVRAVLAYASADLTIDAEQPACGLGWNTLAAIGAIESGHGTHGGAVLGDDGRSTPAILVPVLDGGQFAAVSDSDDGAWDGDGTWDRAVGPMQFIPSTWTRWSADGNGDGASDPNQIDDAALGAAGYLCASGPLTTGEGWRRAVHSYNHSDAYVDEVAGLANRYADITRGLS